MHIRKGYSQALVLALLLSGFYVGHPKDAHAEDAVVPSRILFAGSSSTYFNDMPLQVAELLSAHAGMPAKAILAGRSGSGIHVYLRDGYDDYEYGVPRGSTFLDVVRDGDFDYVVLMAVAQFITGEEGEEHAAALDTYCRAARDAGSEPVIYEMGWRRNDREELGRKKILETAVRNGVEVYVPCSTAWARVYRERPDLRLQDLPDTAHPGALGCYLNLCCFVRAMSGESAVGLPATVRDWAPMDDAAKQRVGEERKRNPPTDPYVNALPGWMQTRSMGCESVAIDPEIAAYLQKVADQACDDAEAALKSKRSSEQ